MIFFKKTYNILKKNKEASIIKKFSFRKAADGGNLVVIGVAIGILVIIGVYLMSQSLMSKTAATNSNINNALIQGVAELRK